MRRTRLALALALAAPCAADRPAWAHGRTPALLSIARSDEGALTLGTTFGLLVSGGAPTSWRWICEEAIGYDARFAPHVAHLPEGAIVVAAWDGLARSTDGGCSWRKAPETLGRGLTGLARAAGTSDLYLTTGGQGPPFVLLRSKDGGVSFAPAGLSHPAPLTNVVAPSAAPRRLYVGAFADGAPPAFLRSDDAGERWRETAHPEEPPTHAFALLAASPHDPDVVFTRTRNAYGNAVWRSDDGGSRFAKVFEAADAPFDVVFPDDRGGVLLLTTGGIHVSSDGGRSFSPPPVALYRPCAAATATGLYLCGDVTSDGWLLGRGPEPWTPLLEDFPRIEGPSACPAGTATAVTCEALWPEVAGEIGAPVRRADAGASPADAGDARVADAGADAGAPRVANGGCAVSAPRGPAGFAWLSCVAAVVVARRRRR